MVIKSKYTLSPRCHWFLRIWVRAWERDALISTFHASFTVSGEITPNYNAIEPRKIVSSSAFPVWRVKQTKVANNLQFLIFFCQKNNLSPRVHFRPIFVLLLICLSGPQISCFPFLANFRKLPLLPTGEKRPLISFLAYLRFTQWWYAGERASATELFKYLWVHNLEIPIILHTPFSSPLPNPVAQRFIDLFVLPRITQIIEQNRTDGALVRA